MFGHFKIVSMKQHLFWSTIVRKHLPAKHERMLKKMRNSKNVCSVRNRYQYLELAVKESNQLLMNPAFDVSKWSINHLGTFRICCTF